MPDQQICISTKECHPARGRSFAIGDRVMFRCERWTVVGLYFAPKGQTVEKMFVLQRLVEDEQDGSRGRA